MNMLAKFNPFMCAEPFDIFLPSYRADNFRDMDDIVRNMQPKMDEPVAVKGKPDGFTQRGRNRESGESSES